AGDPPGGRAGAAGPWRCRQAIHGGAAGSDSWRALSTRHSRLTTVKAEIAKVVSRLFGPHSTAEKGGRLWDNGRLLQASPRLIASIRVFCRGWRGTVGENVSACADGRVTGWFILSADLSEMAIVRPVTSR